MSEQRRFDEDDITVGPAPWATSAALAPEPSGRVQPSPVAPLPAAPVVVPETEPSAPEAAKPGTSGTATPSADVAATPAAPAPQPKAPRRSLSSRLLTALLLLIAGAAGAIYAAPKVAPMLPAPLAALVADWVTPAGGGADAAALAALRRQFDTEIAELRRDLASAGVSASDQAQAVEARLAGLQGGGPDPAVSARIDRLETALAALGETQREAQRRDDAADATTLAMLRTELAGLDRKIETAPAFTAPADLDDLRRRLAALETAVARDVAVREQALAEAGNARRAAAITSALSDIDRAMALGQPFADALVALRESTGLEPPTVLAEAAGKGAPTREAIQAGFSAVAHRAVTEALAADTDGQSGVAEVLARVQARFTGIPNDPVDGDSAPAVLSRVRYDLLNGRIDEALAGVAKLPAPAQAAMADWVDGARLRYGAEAALTQLRARVGRGN